jgi:hypothetical protein
MQDGQVQTIHDISELQTIEKDYFNRLNLGLINDSLKAEEKDTLVKKINEISQMRVNLYQNLNGTYQFYETNVESTQTTLAEQSAAIDIVENELNNAKAQLKVIEEERNNKLRLIEINNYYGEKFNDQSYIMKIIIAICVPVLILSIIANRGLIPGWLFSLLVIVIVSLGCIYLSFKIYDTYGHDNMNYQEFDFTFDKSQAPAIDTSGGSNVSALDTGAGMCVGPDCCTVEESYDSNMNKCVPKAISDTSLGSSTVS